MWAEEDDSAGIRVRAALHDDCADRHCGDHKHDFQVKFALVFIFLRRGFTRRAWLEQLAGPYCWIGKPDTAPCMKVVKFAFFALQTPSTMFGAASLH